MCTRHLDGNETNNRLSNLEYATKSRNELDKKWHRGARNKKLKPADVFEIKRHLGPWGMGAIFSGRVPRQSVRDQQNQARQRSHGRCVMPVLHFDIETRSAANLNKVGARRYAVDPTTEVLCVAYAIDDEEPAIWTPGQPVPQPFIEAAANADW